MKDTVIAAKNGDPDAFGSLYESCRKAGLSIAMQYVKNETDAEDMYQDSFLKAMENIDRFDENREFGPWLNTIIANTCKDYLGKKRPTNFTDMSDDETEFVDTIESSDASSLPESVYVRKEMLQIVDGIVEMLPNEQKEATVLYYFKDFSVKQVAEYQSVSEDTVKSRLNYSRKKVEQATKDYEKKHGIKICIASVIPAILVLYFKNSVYAAQSEAALATLSAAGAAAKAGVGTAEAGSVAAKAGAGAAAKAAAGTAVKTVAAWKIAAIVAAGVIAVIGAGLAINHFVTPDDRDEIVAQGSENTSGESGNQTESDTQGEDAKADAQELTEEEKLAAALKEVIKNAQVGDIIEIGSFEQDGDETNGAEPIEWLVIGTEGGKKLLFSKYILMNYKMDFSSGYMDYTWENFSVRTYLNEEFYESAFTDEEREVIAETEHKTTLYGSDYNSPEVADKETPEDKYGEPLITGEIVTTDRIFIPDYHEELTKYLKGEGDSNWSHGEYLLAKHTDACDGSSKGFSKYKAWHLTSPEGVNLDEGIINDKDCSYLLRTGGAASFDVGADGIPFDIESSVFYYVGIKDDIYFAPVSCYEMDNLGYGIRPMMWVNAE
ncbi:MAG: sigma-70 family RNA polymerase sigma factor [Lachnospiraceae bacterium]|nr:sigma-70 family RNA polymerase sigma factor [Lachnospiraceae bacterium]